jgi:hypothetical protein
MAVELRFAWPRMGGSIVSISVPSSRYGPTGIKTVLGRRVCLLLIMLTSSAVRAQITKNEMSPWAASSLDIRLPLAVAWSVIILKATGAVSCDFRALTIDVPASVVVPLGNLSSRYRLASHSDFNDLAT